MDFRLKSFFFLRRGEQMDLGRHAGCVMTCRTATHRLAEKSMGHGSSSGH